MNLMSAGGRLRPGERLLLLLFSAILLVVFAARCRQLRTEQPEFMEPAGTASEQETDEPDERAEDRVRRSAFTDL